MMSTPKRISTIINFTLIITITNLKLSMGDDGNGAYTIQNLIRFPYSSVEGPFMGIFVALALPLIDLPEFYDISLSYSFEANYDLPQNQTKFSYPPLVERRAWDRKFFYDLFEFKLKSHGYPGKGCLLRAICESSSYSTKNTGILGDLLHITLTPSTSINQNLDSEYQLAENYGKKDKNCKKYTKKCSVSLLDLISRIGSFIEMIKSKS